MKPIFSFVIVTFNNIQFLPKLIKSIQSQTIKNYEVIFVDNNSTDGSIEYIKENMPEAKIIRFKKNKGFCEPNNVGYKKANGDYVVVSNSDIIFTKNYLETVLNAFQKDSKVGIVGSIQLRFEESMKDYILHSTGAIFELAQLGFMTKQFGEINQMQGACFSIKKGILKDIYFKENFAYDDEFFLSFRIKSQGYKIVSDKRIIVWHKGGGSSYFGHPYNEYYLHRNALKNFLTHYNKRTIFVLIPVLILTHLLNDLKLILKCDFKTLNARFKARFFIITNFQSVIKQRKIIQKERKLSDKTIIKTFVQGELDYFHENNIFFERFYKKLIKKFISLLYKIGFW